MSSMFALVESGTRRQLCSKVAIAKTFFQRLRGLLGTELLAAGEGILLVNTNSVHTLFMRYSIDVVFLSKYLRVVKVVSAVRPGRMVRCPEAVHTLELSSGAWQDRGLDDGALLAVEQRPGSSGQRSYDQVAAG